MKFLGPMDAEKKQKCLSILTTLLQHRQNEELSVISVFGEPVDVIKLRLNDYLDKIKRPMDLGTVRKNLTNDKYDTVEKFVDDVQLVHRNAMTYNPARSAIAKLADEMKQKFDIWVDQISGPRLSPRHRTDDEIETILTPGFRLIFPDPYEDDDFVTRHPEYRRPNHYIVDATGLQHGSPEGWKCPHEKHTDCFRALCEQYKRKLNGEPMKPEKKAVVEGSSKRRNNSKSQQPPRKMSRPGNAVAKIAEESKRLSYLTPLKPKFFKDFMSDWMKKQDSSVTMDLKQVLSSSQTLALNSAEAGIGGLLLNLSLSVTARTNTVECHVRTEKNDLPLAIDLYKLFFNIWSLGGPSYISRNSLWQRLALSMGFRLSYFYGEVTRKVFNRYLVEFCHTEDGTEIGVSSHSPDSEYDVLQSTTPSGLFFNDDESMSPRSVASSYSADWFYAPGNGNASSSSHHPPLQRRLSIDSMLSLGSNAVTHQSHQDLRSIRGSLQRQPSNVSLNTPLKHSTTAFHNSIGNFNNDIPISQQQQQQQQQQQVQSQLLPTLNTNNTGVSIVSKPIPSLQQQLNGSQQQQQPQQQLPASVTQQQQQPQAQQAQQSIVPPSTQQQQPPQQYTSLNTLLTQKAAAGVGGVLSLEPFTPQKLQTTNHDRGMRQ